LHSTSPAWWWVAELAAVTIRVAVVVVADLMVAELVALDLDALSAAVSGSGGVPAPRRSTSTCSPSWSPSGWWRRWTPRSPRGQAVVAKRWSPIAAGQRLSGTRSERWSRWAAAAAISKALGTGATSSGRALNGVHMLEADLGLAEREPR
jgi:hypothetical protein